MEPPAIGESVTENLDQTKDTTHYYHRETPLKDESLKPSSKRPSTDGVEDQQIKKDAVKKKKRSSLCTKRRSIVGDEPQRPQEACDIESSEDVASQGSTNSGSTSGSQSSYSQEQRLAANPANLKVESIIQLMEDQIKRLNSEHDEWQDLVRSFVSKKEESEALVSNLTMAESSISDDVKALVASDYIKVKPCNLQEIRNRITTALTNYKFDKEAVIDDMRFFKKEVEIVRFENKLKAEQLRKLVASMYPNRDDEEEDFTDVSDQLESFNDSGEDPRDALTQFMLNY